MYSENFALQFTTTDTALSKLNEEIKNLIGQRLVTYEASLQISSRGVFCQLHRRVLRELISSDFYIDDLHDTDSLVEHIHKLQRKCCGEELDKFLYNYALLEYLEERITLVDVTETDQSKVAINYYAPVTYEVGGNLNNYPNAKTVNNYGK